MPVLGEDTLANLITHSVTCCFCWVLGAGPQRGHVGQLYYAFSNVLFLLGVGGQPSQIKSLDFHVEAERLAHKSRAAVCLGVCLRLAQNKIPKTCVTFGASTCCMLFRLRSGPFCDLAFVSDRVWQSFVEAVLKPLPEIQH